jgi:hypothetical protein
VTTYDGHPNSYEELLSKARDEGFETVTAWLRARGERLKEERERAAARGETVFAIKVEF